jgi:uncharacterized tellurite resistance protein B-like protein
MLIETPVSAAEREQLSAVLTQPIHTDAYKQDLLAMLSDMTEEPIDGEARELVAAVTQVITEADVGVLARLGKIVRRTIGTPKANQTAGRQAEFEDYVNNRVYFEVRQRLALDEADMKLPDDTWRKLSLAGGLMAQIAYVDREVTAAEFDRMCEALRHHWDVDEKTAVFITEVATAAISADLDYYRLTRQFFAQTIVTERVQFLDVLFAIASADGGVSHEESENIRRISVSLNLVQQQFIEAKTKFV